MRKYLITHKKTKATLLFTFDENSVLKAFKSEIKSSSRTAEFYKSVFPFEEKGLEYFKTNKEFEIELVEQDLSFDAFWNTFNNKVGNKKRANKLWVSLTDVDKAKALSYIKRYDNILKQSNVQKLYPETYLSQERYNN